MSVATRPKEETRPQRAGVLEFDGVREVLHLYAKALSGREVLLTPQNFGLTALLEWRQAPTDDAAWRVIIPEHLGEFPTKHENFQCYKVMVTHQIGYLEFGTFRFRMDRPSTLFQDRRPTVGAGVVGEESPETLGALFSLFADRPLGVLIFNAVEAARIDARILDHYPGTRSTVREVASMLLAKRPRLAALTTRAGLIEGLVQLSLGAGAAELPRALAAQLRLVADLLRCVKSPAATVEDSAEAALRIYEIAVQLHDYDHDHDHDHDEEPLLIPVQQAGEKADQLTVADGDSDQDEPDAVPELETPDDGPVADPSAAASREGSHPTAEPEVRAPLQLDGPFTYLYPEWDFRARRLRGRWCRVREDVLGEGASDFYQRAAQENRWLVKLAQATLDRLTPELFRMTSGYPDGEEVDLAALVDFVVERRMGRTPSERLFRRRARTQRDVAVAILLDMSATTDEPVTMKAAQESRPATAAPGALSEYLAGVAAGVDRRGRPLRRRKIDIEKEAAIILMQALEAVGDTYALFGFSGSGRAEVAFLVIKDFLEPLGPRVARRIDEIQPSYATRMGAAIRHATRRLNQVDAGTRLLLLLSDGRPYDRDYGRDEDDAEYAVHDTREALREAQRSAIRPFCVTIDQKGEDYLQAMCDDVPYEVVTEIEDLPLRMTALYSALAR